MRRHTAGFTLIELMIVVAIIGILAAIAIPNFLKFQAKSKQAEAKVNLSGIFVAQSSYFSTNDTYASFTDIGFYSSEAAARLYTYRDGVEVQPGKNGAEAYSGAAVVGYTADGFTATAAGTISNTGLVDSWFINDQRQLVNEVSGY
jgi:type IV pilus assembly protein PilA